MAIKRTNKHIANDAVTQNANTVIASNEPFASNERQIHTVKSLCGYLDLTERTVTDLLRAKKIKGYKVFNKWLIFHNDLIAYIKTQKTNIDL